MRMLTIAGVLSGALGLSCSAGGSGERGLFSGSSGGSGNGSGGSLSLGGDNGSGGSVSFGGDAGSAGASAGGACQTAVAEASVQPVNLAFAFDVSGSMGKGDEEWHDKSLKWDPVVAATKAFFADPASEGFTASMTFFPDAGDEDERCVLAAYTTPDVPISALPSDAFGAAIDVIAAQEWRGGTPTAWVIRGTIAFIQQQVAANPGARSAIVLVTDGYPQGCSDTDDQVSTVANEVAAVALTIPTYVIGVANPPIDGAPDTVTNLQQIAQAGGTERAYLIDTGNPAQTSADFSAAINQIRGASVSCVVGIPPAPDNRTFDKEKVSVRYTSSGSPVADLTYDPDCLAENTWHYDDPANPTQIVLCASTCGTVQADTLAALNVEFTCEQTIVVVQ